MLPRDRSAPRRSALCRGSRTLLFVIVGGLSALTGQARDAVLVRLAPFDLERAIGELERRNVDIAGRRRDLGTVDVVVRSSEVAALRSLGVIRAVEETRPFAEVAAERRRLGGPEPGYRTYAEVLEHLFAVEVRHPEIARVHDLTLELGAPPTAEGRHLYAIEISDRLDRLEAEPRILFDALHHARELNTIEVALDIVDTLTDLYAVVPAVTRWVDELEVWVVPVVNPDGLEFVWSGDQFWRKNRRDHGGGVFGVDLNRNYPFLWGACGNHSDDPGSDVYRGSEPASEPEVATLMAFAEAIRPVIANSYHSSGREVLGPYVCAELAEPELLSVLGHRYRAAMDYGFRLASSSGESFEWMYNQTSSMAFLTEIGTAFQPPFEETLDEVRRVRRGWALLLDTLLDGPLVRGAVRDAVTDAPVVAEITTASVPFSEGERRASEAEQGLYGWILPPGPLTLTFTADGYDPLTVELDVAADGAVVDVPLLPVAAE